MALLVVHNCTWCKDEAAVNCSSELYYNLRDCECHNLKNSLVLIFKGYRMAFKQFLTLFPLDFERSKGLSKRHCLFE